MRALETIMIIYSFTVIRMDCEQKSGCLLLMAL